MAPMATRRLSTAGLEEVVPLNKRPAPMLLLLSGANKEEVALKEEEEEEERAWWEAWRRVEGQRCGTKAAVKARRRVRRRSMPLVAIRRRQPRRRGGGGMRGSVSVWECWVRGGRGSCSKRKKQFDDDDDVNEGGEAKEKG